MAKTDELRPEYKREDLGTGTRGVHYRAYCEGSNLEHIPANRASVRVAKMRKNKELDPLSASTESESARVLLGPDVAAAVPTEQAVNEALRSLMKAGEPAGPDAPAQKDRGG